MLELKLHSALLAVLPVLIWLARSPLHAYKVILDDFFREFRVHINQNADCRGKRDSGGMYMLLQTPEW